MSLRALRIFQRRKPIWAADQSCQQRGFGKIQLGRAFAEIDLRSGLNPIATIAEINPVYVKLEDLLFGKLALDTQGHHRFQQFPAEGAAAEWKAVSGELLGNTAGAFFGRAARDIANQSAQNPAPINSLVLIESSVFARQHPCYKKCRNFAERNLQAICAGKATVDFSIDIVNGVSLRHFTDILHVEGLRPRPVKEENRKASSSNKDKQRDLRSAKERSPSSFF